MAGKAKQVVLIYDEAILLIVCLEQLKIFSAVGGSLHRTVPLARIRSLVKTFITRVLHQSFVDGAM